MTRGCGGVGDGLEVWKDSENSRRHSSAPRACKFARIDSGREERGGNERRREREGEIIAGSWKTRERARRVKYLTDAATKRPEQTTNKQTKTGIRRLHGACPREARSPSRFSNSPACPTLRRLRGMRWRKAKRIRGCQLHVMFLNPRSDDRLHVQRERTFE